MFTVNIKLGWKCGLSDYDGMIVGPKQAGLHITVIANLRDFQAQMSLEFRQTGGKTKNHAVSASFVNC